MTNAEQKAQNELPTVSKVTPVFIANDFAIEGTLPSWRVAVPKRPPLGFTVEWPGPKGGKSQGAIWKHIVKPGLERCDRCLAFLDSPNANVGFEIGYALGLGKEVALARIRADLPKWIGEPPLNGFMCPQLHNPGEVRALIAGDEWFKIDQMPTNGDGVLILCPSNDGQAYLEEIDDAWGWRKPPSSGWDLTALPTQMSGVGLVLWIITPHNDGDMGRDGTENAALSVIAGFAESQPNIELAVLAHKSSRQVADIVASRTPFTDSDPFAELAKGIVENWRAGRSNPHNVNSSTASNVANHKIAQCLAKDKVYLDLSEMNLSEIPGDIAKLTRLTSLYLSGNELTFLPPEIGQLAVLKQLCLDNNKLQSLPPEIGKLTQLERLTLENNSLSELPETMAKLTKLQELTLHGNDALRLPPDLLGPISFDSSEDNPPTKPQEILNCYFESVGNQGQALREMMVQVVGRGGVGKTSVIRRLLGLPLDKLQAETHGIAVEELSLPCADGPVVVRFWDFGGQDFLHGMHEFFFGRRSLYILVLGEREDMAEGDAEYWLQLIRIYAGKAPVIVVLNKSGYRARELDLPRQKLEDTYGPILAWLSTECHEDDLEKGGITILKDKLTVAVGAMPEIQARFPKKWMRIKEWLSGMKESYLDYRTYADRCSELGETDPAKQEELAAFLHDLGVALNYRRDPRLHETTVLRPDWLADGIYALLRANDTLHPRPLAPDGRIQLERMPEIYAAAEALNMLKATDYPPDKHPFLLRLMAAFQLSFPLNEEGTEHLVPALLSVEEPEGLPTELLAKPDLEFRWDLPVVVGPLLSRLLVRTLGLIMNDWRWRRGAFYHFGPAVAKVWEEKERYLYLTASAQDKDDGPEALADLVRMIRTPLREIVAEYKNLTVEEQVPWKGKWMPRSIAEDLGVCEPDADAETPNQENLP